VRAGAGGDAVVSAWVRRPSGEVLASASINRAQLRDGALDVPLAFASDGQPVMIQIVAASGATVDLDYVEVFTQRFGLVASPGSGIYADTDMLTFELPPQRALDKIMLDGADITPRLADLLSRGKATRTTTDYRTLFEVAVGDLAPERGSSSELELRAGLLAARMQLRREPPPCQFDGDARGPKILVTGFQPFPADGWHDNVAGVAVTALDPAQLSGVQVMRIVMPVEYDRAADEVTDAIARCAPDAVISFGQGGSEIALERTAYNLQDTGEVAGGVPDNRGVIRAGALIDEAAPATRDTLLPLDDIRRALEAAGETPAYSTDPGRYICNNVMFADVGAMAARGGLGGFIHLPYTTDFDDATRARFANVVRVAVQTTADALR
jgi:pyroglutamyl-peptidase